MEYSFNAEIAKKYGVDEAVFIHNLYWWIAKNEANGRHFHDGHSWTYNSMEAFAKLFPFWTVKQIRRIIQKLEDSGALLIGNYNKKPFDRTRWYALTEDVNSIYQKGTIDVPKRADHNCPNGQISTAQMGRPIPDNKPDSKPDCKLYSPVVGYLNEKAGTGYRPGSHKTRALIDARVNEGFTLEDFKTVIDRKCADWNHAPPAGEKDMRPYLRPETLFGPKFESYLNQKGGGRYDTGQDDTAGSLWGRGISRA